MKNSILSEFFRGSLTPAEQRVVNGSEMARAVDEMSKTAELLEQTLPPELQPILQRLTEAQLAINGVGSEAFYIEGFKTGARFMLAIMDDDSENLNKDLQDISTSAYVYPFLRTFLSSTYTLLMEAKVGIVKSGWLFFDKITVSNGDNPYSKSYDYFSVNRDIISGSTVSEYVYISDSNFFTTILTSAEAGSAAIRFSNADTRETYDHDMSEIEISAIDSLTRICNLHNSVWSIVHRWEQIELPE